MCAVIDVDAADARDAGPAHATGHYGRVTGHAAARGQDAAGRVHAMDVLRAGLDPHQDHRLALRRAAFRLVGVEQHRAGGGPRAGGQPLGEQGAGRVRVEHRVQQLVERGRNHALDRFLPVDEARLGHLHGDPEAGRRGPLAAPGLQHVEPVLLHGELDVLHVAVVLLELLAHLHELGVRLRQRLLHGHLTGLGALA